MLCSTGLPRDVGDRWAGFPPARPDPYFENRARKILVFVMDVLRPLPYLAGLLNRMDIKAIAASPSFAMRTRNHEAWETPHNSGVA